MMKRIDIKEKLRNVKVAHNCYKFVAKKPTGLSVG